MPAIDEHLEEEDNYEICQELLNTIKFPRNIKHLNNRLPKSQYKEGDFESQQSLSENKKSELATKNSQPVLPVHKSMSDVPDDIQREIAKYEAIAEIERKYGGAKSGKSKGKKQRQIPKTTPSSHDGIPNIYMQYRDKARGIAESIKKKNSYLQLKEKYSKRAQEVEEIEKREKLLLHKRIAGDMQPGESYDSPGLYKDRNNYHYHLKSGRGVALHSHGNSKSEDYREPSSQNYRALNIIKHSNHKLPPTTKAMDNLSIDEKEARKARILQHAREIREAVSLNREKATGMISRVTDNAPVYVPSPPKWWG
jgi:hypothetical protein